MNLSVRKDNSQGFTLIELLVVIAIIGVLTSVVLASLNSARAGARDAQRIAEIRQLQTALELYYDANGHYPRTSPTGSCGASTPNASWCNSVESLSGSHWVHDRGTAGVLSPFMSSEPIDPIQGSSPNWTPLNGGTVFYWSPGREYMIIFGLENYPHPLELQDGVTNCNGIYRHYGNNSNGIITLGSGCS